MFGTRRALLVPFFASLTVLASSAACSSNDATTDPAGSDGDGGAGSDGGRNDGGTTDDASATDGGRDGGPKGDGGFTAARTTVDQPDDMPGAYQAHVLYVEPSDRSASPGLDVDGTLRRSVTAFNRWLASRADGARIRVDTYNGVIDVTHVKLAVTENVLAQGLTTAPTGPRFIHERLRALLEPTFADPKKIYLVYYDGLAFGTCGDSPRPDRMPMAYVGGIWSSTFLAGAANAGATSIAINDPVSTNVPAAPFAAKLGAESVQVTQVSGTTATLAAPLAAAHPQGDILKPDNRPPDCRNNAFSRDGVEWTYATYVQLHEIVHALGMVSDGAPDFALSPVAAGHLNASSTAGVADLMYQGNQNNTCGNTVPDAVNAACELDPGHDNYFKLQGSGLVDFAKSVFLEPSAADATLPPGW